MGRSRNGCTVLVTDGASSRRTGHPSRERPVFPHPVPILRRNYDFGAADLQARWSWPDDTGALLIAGRLYVDVAGACPPAVGCHAGRFLIAIELDAIKGEHHGQ